MSRRWIVGVDVGGTFTDLAAVDESTGELVVGKQLTTPDDPLVGLVSLLANALGDDFAASPRLLHGTTLAINTLIERKGASVALLTTRGFRDVLEVGREDRYDLYDLQIDSPPSLVPRELRLGVTERISARGDVLEPLEEASLRTVVRRLRRAKVDAVAVCFLNSYANDVHERDAAALVAAELPAAYVSRSSDVAPIIREYERFVATAVNGYIGPTMASYLRRLSAGLERLGFRGQVGIMKSDGGVASPDEAQRIPVQMLESGPAAGATFAATLATACGLPRILAFDMGGTTAKACLVLDGRPILTDELEVDRRVRLRQGSGLPLRLPSIDLIEVGAGGGSIASLGPLELLQVGPLSAGARPGPACYGLGGDQPTVTDADLVLGYLRPDSFSAGGPILDRDAAARAIRRHVAEPLGLDDVLAAWAIHDLVNENMAHAARLHAIEHGIDPASVWLVAMGGAGPLHASGLLAKLGCEGVLYPRSAGVASAIGLVLAPWSVERSVTSIRRLASLPTEEIESRLAAIERSLPQAGLAGADVVIERCLNMRIRGQAYEVKVEVPRRVAPNELAVAFRSRYTERFGLEPATDDFEVVSWSVRRIERSQNEFSLAVLERAEGQPARRIFLGPDRGLVEVTVAGWGAFVPGRPIVGPLLVEDATTTVVVGAGQQAMLDALGNLRVTTR